MRLFLYSAAASATAKADSQSFLFTLINPSGNEPVKIIGNRDSSILCCSKFGPTFGNTKVYNDLQVWSNFTPRAGYLTLGYGFKRPENVQSSTYFTGKSPFDISELEVFKVNL